MQGYAADWDGSGQIPARLVSTGMLDRFGSIDPTEGGRTDRENLLLDWRYTPTPSDTWEVHGYAQRYKLRLWSDFTFFANSGLRFVQYPDGGIEDTGDGPVRPNAKYIPGDEIYQGDSRVVFGGRGSYTRNWFLASIPQQSQLALETRTDDVHIKLQRAVRRTSFFTVNDVYIQEHSFSGYWAQQIFFTDWLRFEGGLRGDFYIFDVNNRLPSQGPDPNFRSVFLNGYTTAGLPSPKANLIITPVEDTELYLNFGRGFHSNDARSTVTGAFTGSGPSGSGVVAAEQPTPLVKALGYEVGARTHLFDRLDLAAAVWNLNLGSELVFSGDAGTDEASSLPSRRYGVDFEARWQINTWLYADYDLSWSHARFSDGGFVPLAVPLFMNGGLTADFHNGLTVALRGRYVSDRAGNEDDTVTARGLLPARSLRALPLAQSRAVAPAAQPDQHRLARGAVRRQLLRPQRDAEPESGRPLLRQTGPESRHAGRQHSLHAREPDRRGGGPHLVFLTIRMDFSPSGLRLRGGDPYEWGPTMSDHQQRQRLTAALLASAILHAAMLALVLRSASIVDLLTGPFETPEAKLIPVSLVSRAGGGGGGPLAGLPSAPAGHDDRPPLPEALPAARPSPPPPLPAASEKKMPPVATPSSTAVASLRALAPPPQPRAPAPAALAARAPCGERRRDRSVRARREPRRLARRRSRRRRGRRRARRRGDRRRLGRRRQRRARPARLRLQPEAALSARGTPPGDRGRGDARRPGAARRLARGGAGPQLVGVAAPRRLGRRDGALALAVHPGAPGEHPGREPRQLPDPLQARRRLSRVQEGVRPTAIPCPVLAGGLPSSANGPSNPTAH